MGRDGLVATYAANCPRCGKPRSFEFLLDSALEPPPPAFGHATPSKLIDPGEFLVTADEAAKDAPDSLAGLSDERVERAKRRLAVAVAAKEEVLRCARCGGRRRVVAWLTHCPAVREVLEHLGLPAHTPPLAPARGPPQPDFWQ
jgi:hypothetical protein